MGEGNSRKVLVEDVTHLFSKGYFETLIEFHKKKEWYGPSKSAIIDTNYLIQINWKDLISMFFEEKYEEKISNPLKKQMARLFRSHTRGEIALYFSDSIAREFIYVSPDKIDLVPLYTKHLYKIGSKRQFESFFLDLASLLNLGAKERGHKVDLMDTYSYVISNLAGIDYFITENIHLKGIFAYLNNIRNSNHLDKVNEIKKLMINNSKLFDIKEENFPIRRIIEYLFLSNERLTIPINIKDITDSLTKVSEKAESVITLCENLNEIEENKELLDQKYLPFVARARELINGIFESLNFEKPKERINIPNLSIILIEKESIWKKPKELEEIHSFIFDAIQDIYNKMYPEEEEYTDLEDFFNSTLSELEIKVRCECGHEFTTWIGYRGVVSAEEREMGQELLHVWNNYVDCPKCDKSLEIELQLWEYPTACLNYVDFDSDCEVLNVEEIYRKIGIEPQSGA